MSDRYSVKHSIELNSNVLIDGALSRIPTHVKFLESILTFEYTDLHILL